MTSAIIVAAGKSTRMGGHIDKLFLEIRGCPVVGHTWRRFDTSPGISEIVLVIREGRQPDFERLKAMLGLQKPSRLVPGGKERQDSVWNGLMAVSASAEIVAVHDAARPCVSHRLISATIDAAVRMGAAVAAQPVTDTIKESGDGRRITGTLDRSRLWAVQTPQTFRIELLKHALQEARKKGVVLTDDTAACELINQPVELVRSAEMNPKLTRPEDLPLLEALLGIPEER